MYLSIRHNHHNHKLCSLAATISDHKGTNVTIPFVRMPNVKQPETYSTLKIRRVNKTLDAGTVGCRLSESRRIGGILMKAD